MVIQHLNTHYLARYAKTSLALYFLSNVFCPTIFAQNNNILVESSFQPPSITLANSSVYKIVIFGSQENPKGAIPQIPGLTISNSPQTFRSASFINGVPSVRLELSFQVKPKQQGQLTIPSWTVQVGSKALNVPPSTLQVLAPNQQDEIEKNRQEKQNQDLKQASFIEFVKPREFLFEGETVSGSVNLYIWDSLPVSRIERAPQKEGDAFSLTELGQPQEKRNRTKFNKKYTVFTWPVGLTAAIPGKQSIKFNTSIRVRVKSQGNSPFASPFFNDPFFGFGREQSLTVSSELLNILVKPLPTIDRPESFQGAIGTFTTRSIPDADRVSLGDPVRLIFEIEGTGNFSAMPAPLLESDNNFKIGPPAFSFEGNEITKHSGKQSFEYILTPLTPGLLTIPAINFSYFDPVQETYNTSATNPHPLRVDPGETWVDPTPSENKQNESFNEVATTDLFQTENEPGEWVKDIKNLTLLDSKLFWLLQGVPLLCVFGLSFYGWKRKQSGRDIFRQKQANLKKQMKECIQYKDATLFFRATRERLRLEIGTFYKHANPSSLSSHELNSLLQQGSNDEGVISGIQKILLASDNQEFAETEKDTQSLETLYREMNDLLKKIK